MGGFRGLIGGLAQGGIDMLDRGMKQDAELEREKRQNEMTIESEKRRDAAAMAREGSMLRLRATLENEQRTAQAGRIDTAAGAIADQATGKTQALVGAGIADREAWTPEQQAAVDQSIAIDKKALISDPMTRVKAAGMTGDLRADQVATVELNEARGAREEKKGDQRYEVENKKLDQQIKHQDATLAETIKHNRALEANSANKADKLSPAAKAQLEIAANGVQSAHKEESIAARSLDAALRSTEMDPDKKKADIALARAEFASAKNAVANANAKYDKVGQAHLGAEWKSIEVEKAAEKEPARPTPNAAALEFLRKNPGTKDKFIETYGPAAVPKTEPTAPTEPTKPAAAKIGAPATDPRSNPLSVMRASAEEYERTRPRTPGMSNEEYQAQLAKEEAERKKWLIGR